MLRPRVSNDPEATKAAADLEQALGPVTRRIRAVRAARAFALYALLGGMLAIVAGLLVGLGWLDVTDRSRAQLGGALLAMWGLVLGWMRVPTAMESALLVDRTHRSSGRIAAGVALVQAGAPSAMARLAIEDAAAHARTIDTARALPWTAPRHLRPALAALLVAALAALLQPTVAAPPLPEATRPTLHALSVHPDDLAVLHDRLASLPERRRSPELRAEIDALNAVMEDLSAHEVDRTEALRRLGEIAEGLRDARPSTLDATLETLTGLARPLSSSPLSASIGEALADGDLLRAATEMERLSERMESDPPSAAELARLREAMAAAARETDPEALRREREALEEQRDRLLHREEEEAARTDAERTTRDEERERELERLRRDIEERREREAELDALRRELEEAMSDRDRSGAESGDSAMERAAEDLHRFADEAGAEQEREDLAREAEALREMIRRMREGGSGEGGEGGEGSESESPSSGEGGGSRMDRFVLRARGEGSEGDGEGTPIGVPGEAGGESGEGSTEGSEGEGGEGERAESTPGAGREGGGEGEGEGGGEGEMLVLGEGTARLELPGMGSSGRGEEGPGSGSEGRADSEGSGHGTGPGDGLGDSTGRSGEHTTVRVAGEAGRGPTRSEVIRTSAARGFASSAYRDVYGDYRAHAEEALEDEEIPPGYRFYVERYFQLIRPRE